MEEMARELMEAEGYIDQGWEVDSETTLICPCGTSIEWDGECGDGHSSPLMTMGLI